MSEYRKTQTNAKDPECLIAALVAMGYAREHIEVHEEAVQLFDYHGRATTYTDVKGDRANIIVRRQHVGGAANDLGFKLNKTTGVYDAVISAYDRGKHNEKWLAGLKTNYSEGVTTKQAKKMGFKFLGKKVVDGKIQMQFLDTRA